MTRYDKEKFLIATNLEYVYSQFMAFKKILEIIPDYPAGGYILAKLYQAYQFSLAKNLINQQEKIEQMTLEIIKIPHIYKTAENNNNFQAIFNYLKTFPSQIEVKQDFLEWWNIMKESL